MDSSKQIRILFSGQYLFGANTLFISRAFEACGAILRWFDESMLFPRWESKAGRAGRRLLWPLIEQEWNRQFLAAYYRVRPDLVYITNGHYCFPATLAQIRNQGTKIVCFYHDPPWKNRPLSRFESNLSYFDLVVSTRQWHKAEFLEAGAKAVLIARFGYDPSTHRPVRLAPRLAEYYGADIAFVGTYRAGGRRVQDLTALVEGDFPYSMRIWGSHWHYLPATSPLRPYCQFDEVYDGELAAVYAGTKVALHWLNWEPESSDSALRKGDQHNSRSFQIPASGGAIMMAQRSPEHQQFFKEDVEAVFFDNLDELRVKLHHLLAPGQEEARRAMAAAARQRCLDDDYSYVPVVRQILDHFGFGAP